MQYLGNAIDKILNNITALVGDYFSIGSIILLVPC